MKRFSNKQLIFLRYIASGLVIAGYFTILFGNVLSGVIMTLVSDVISIPYSLRMRYWDLLIVIAIFSAINIIKLVTMVM